MQNTGSPNPNLPASGARVDSSSKLAVFPRWLLARLSRETSSGRFIPEMDGLRFVAIGMVVLFHLNGYLAGYFTSQSSWFGQVALVGFRGVELFFVISGFILGLPFAAHYLRNKPAVSLRKYYLRRLTRLEPPYFVAVIGLLFLMHWIHNTDLHALSPHLMASLAYLHNLTYGSPSSVMGVAWSLEIEVQFYLLVPALTLLFAIPNRALRRLSLCALIVLVISLQRSLWPHPRLSLSILGYLQYFLIGFLLVDIFVTDWKESPARSLYWDLAALAGWPLLMLALQSRVLSQWLFPPMLLVLYCAAFRGLMVNRIFRNAWITAIGGMCYSIYLVHYQIISAVGRFTRRISAGAPYGLHLFVQLILVGAAVVVFSGLYFVLLEKPCMQRDWPQRLWMRMQSLWATKQQVMESKAAD